MAAQLRHALLPSAAVVDGIRRCPPPFRLNLNLNLRLRSLPRPSSPFSLLRPFSSNPNLPHRNTIPELGGGGGGINKPPPGGTGGSGGSDNHGPDEPSDPPSPFDFFLTGWRSRVSADPQFPFKVLMEQLVGVTACVLGDMASRPNFGLNELDFVFSTLVVGSILNFVLMYLLAPTSAASLSTSALPSYMFEPGAYSLLSRMGAFAYKGVVFAGVGFAAGIAGTMLSNGLMAMRKRMDPTFETPNAPPPTLLNATTWALHMGLSSNLRYQSLNGVEFVLGKVLPPVGFKTAVVVLRVLNNVLGGVSFVALARLTGSQKAAGKGEEKERLVGDGAAVEAIAVVKGGDEELRRGEDHSSK